MMTSYSQRLASSRHFIGLERGVVALNTSLPRSSSHHARYIKHGWRSQRSGVMPLATGFVGLRHLYW